MGNTSNVDSPTNDDRDNNKPNVRNAATSMGAMLDNNTTPVISSTIDQRQIYHNQQQPHPTSPNYQQTNTNTGYINNTQQYNPYYQQQAPTYTNPAYQQTVTMQQPAHNPNILPKLQQIQLLAEQEKEIHRKMQQLQLAAEQERLQKMREDLKLQQKILDNHKKRMLQQQQPTTVQPQPQLPQQQQQPQQQVVIQQQKATSSDQSSIKQQQTQTQTQTQIRNKQVKQQHRVLDNPTNEKYPVIFHWSHGGRDVYVAYSGDNWSQKYRMHRSSADFSLIMEIQPGIYHYKFIVDNQWRCAPDQKHVRDSNGAYSNVLDVRSQAYQDVIDAQKKKRKVRQHKIQYKYTQSLPNNDQYVQDPPICPIHLHRVILNNDDNLIKNQNNKNQNKTTINYNINDNKTTKINTMVLPKPLRVSLNHLYVSDKREEEVVTLGMTERYKDKFFTTVYYKPIESRGTFKTSFQVSSNYY